MHGNTNINLFAFASKPKGDLFLSMWIIPDAIYTNKNYLYHQDVVAWNSSTQRL